MDRATARSIDKRPTRTLFFNAISSPFARAFWSLLRARLQCGDQVYQAVFQLFRFSDQEVKHRCTDYIQSLRIYILEIAHLTRSDFEIMPQDAQGIENHIEADFADLGSIFQSFFSQNFIPALASSRNNRLFFSGYTNQETQRFVDGLRIRKYLRHVRL